MATQIAIPDSEAWDRGQKSNTLYFLKPFPQPRDIPAKIPRHPAKKFLIPGLRGTYRTFWSPPLLAEDPQRTGRYPERGSAGFCGGPRDFPRFFGGSDPMLVTRELLDRKKQSNDTVFFVRCSSPSVDSRPTIQGKFGLLPWEKTAGPQWIVGLGNLGIHPGHRGWCPSGIVIFFFALNPDPATPPPPHPDNTPPTPEVLSLARFGSVSVRFGSVSVRFWSVLGPFLVGLGVLGR